MDKLDDRFFNHGKMKEVNISEEMKDDFLSYSMSVIIDRALPDVRDGMKPVHRRVIWAMYDAGFTPDKQQVKSANIVGEVMGKYHPHGDTAIYDTMVRMAQTFSYRYPLVDGHGNFGSLDGDGAAAMRYTEARMSKISMELVEDIKKETIDWKDNYDARHLEPVVLPSKFPNLLVNGSMGIAVGMATNMPPHNLGEVIDGIIAQIDNPEITTAELMEYIPGPDFPTGGIIVGRSGIRQAYETGRGSIIVRSKVEVEDMKQGRHKIVIKEIPYLVNKLSLYEKIHSLAKEKIIDGISEMKDLSNARNGVRIEIELKKDVNPDLVLNQLYKLTPVQSSFGVNNNVLVNNAPQLLPLKELIRHYINHQIDVVTRRTRYDLEKAEERAHILEGLKIALDNIDEIIAIIRGSNDDPEALKKFHDRFGLDEAQGKAILDMQLRRLTGLQREKIEEELNELLLLIDDLKDILSKHSRIMDIIKEELTEVKQRFGDKRRTEIIEGEISLEDEDLIPVENIVVTMTKSGYIKRLTLDPYRTQNRGGRGVRGMSLNEDDLIDQVLSMSSHDWLLCYTNTGRVFRIKGYQVPSSGRTGKGIPIINLLKLEKGETIKALVPADRDEEGKYLFFCTVNGLVKRTPLSEFDSIRNNGKIAISLKEGDELFGVKLTTGKNHIIIAGSNGKAVRFNEKDVRVMGRNASGVRGFNLDGAKVVGLATDQEGEYILAVTENGYGKKTKLSEYRITKRGAKGVRTVNITQKNGPLVAMKAVDGDEDLLIITDAGIVIRISLSSVSEHGRNTQGVKLINMEDSKVSAIEVVEPSSEEESEEEEDA